MGAQALVQVGGGAACSHELIFGSLRAHAPNIFVPCDESGKVDIDSLSQRMRDTYFWARAMIGREYSYPAVQCADHSLDQRSP